MSNKQNPQEMQLLSAFSKMSPEAKILYLDMADQFALLSQAPAKSTLVLTALSIKALPIGDADR